MVSNFCLTFKLFETVFAAAEKLFPLQNSNFFLMHLSPNFLFANFRCYNPCHTGILYEETVVKNFVHFTCYYSCLSNTYLYSYLRWHRPLSDYLQPFVKKLKVVSARSTEILWSNKCHKFQKIHNMFSYKNMLGKMIFLDWESPLIE